MMNIAHNLKIVEKPCLCCGSFESFSSYQIINQFELKICSCCGLVITSNVRYRDVSKLYENKDYYSEQGGSGFDIEGYLKHGSKDGISQQHLSNRLLPIRNFISKKNIKYLDVGCSAGHLLALGRELGWEVSGVETSPVAAKFAREKLGLSIIEEKIENLNLANSSYDVISMFHVLEHMEDPAKIIGVLTGALNENGLLVIEVPNIKSLAARIRKKSWNGYLLPYHLWHFSLENLTQLLRKNDLEIVYHQTPYIPLASASIINAHGLLVNIFSKIKTFFFSCFKKNKMKDDTCNTSTIKMAESSMGGHKLGRKHQFLSFIMKVFYYPFDKIISFFGVSQFIYVIAKKKGTK